MLREAMAVADAIQGWLTTLEAELKGGVTAWSWGGALYEVAEAHLLTMYFTPPRKCAIIARERLDEGKNTCQ